MTGGNRDRTMVYRIYARLPSRMRELVRSMVPSGMKAKVRYRARGERKVIAAELAALDGTPWTRPRSGYSTAGMTERVVEIPWTLSRYADEHRVLDVGPAFAIPEYLRHLLGMGIPDLHGVDLAPRAIPGMTMTQADVRAMPYPDQRFELAICISTLEHIGRDNPQWGIDGSGQNGDDVRALEELRRVLTDGGRLLVTVPFGVLRYYDWFKQYDLDAWTDAVNRSGLHTVEVALFRYGPTGWGPAVGADLASADYLASGAPGAAGLLCATLRR